MGQILKVNGDYNITTAEGGNITLNTGAGIGNVLVTGNLAIQGETFRIDVEQIAVQDNIITLNVGDPGTIYPNGGGVTLRYAGLEVNRGEGVLSNAAFVFDEETDTWLIAEGSDNDYSFINSNLKLRRITTDPLVDSGNLSLLGANSSTGKVTVAGTTDYENRITDDDDIPNKAYVDRRILTDPSNFIIKDNSQVIVEDRSSYPLLSESQVRTIVDGSTSLTVYNNRVRLQGLEVTSNAIRNPTTNENIRLVTLGTGKVEVEYGTQFNYIVTTPTAVPDATVLYGATPGVASDSGVYFVNSTISGELISKRKALTFSLIF